jgi:homoserine dehydrogenase
MAERLNVGLVGFGVVGAGLVHCLQENQRQIAARTGVEVRLKTIADLDIKRDRGVNTEGIQLTTDASSVLDDPEVDVVVELVGGTEFAYNLIKNALEAGKDVITANKALLAYRGHELFPLAQEKGRLLLFEAAVAGGIPIIEALKRGVCSTRIDSIHGIVNGTANYILTRMEEARLDFGTALKEAQEKGYAEADPTFDIEGHDTAHKIVLLSEMAFGCRVRFEDVYREGITRLTYFDLEMAEELGYRIKLLAVAKRHGNELEVRCHPTLVPLDHQLAAVMGVYNAIVVTGHPLGPAMFYGQGAGGAATGAAVAADVMEAARQKLAGASRVNLNPLNENEFKVRPMGETCGGYYLKLILEDRPGILAQIAKALGDRSISIASLTQRDPHHPHYAVPVVMTTHPAPEKDMVSALQAISNMEGVREDPYLLRIESFE